MSDDSRRSSDSSEQSSKRVQDPMDRVAEILFGLIMVLTVTGSLSVAQAGQEDIRTMLFGAVGCNLAWGVIDAVLYLMGRLAAKEHGLRIFRAVRKATDPRQTQRLIADALPPVVAIPSRSNRTALFHSPRPPVESPPKQARYIPPIVELSRSICPDEYSHTWRTKIHVTAASDDR